MTEGRSISTQISRKFLAMVYEILLPYFRGYYSNAAGSIQKISKSSKELAKGEELWKYGAEFFQTYAYNIAERDRSKWEAASEKLVEDLKKEKEDAKDEEKRTIIEYYLFFSFIFRGWAFSSLRDVSNLEKSIDFYNQARGLSNENEKLIDVEWLVFSYRAWSHYYLGKHEKAIEDYNRSVRSVNLWIRNLQKNRAIGPSDVYIREFVKDNIPVFARTVAMRGMIFFELGDFDSALIDLQTAKEVDAYNPYVLTFKALVHYSKGEYLAAMKELNAAVELIEKAAKIEEEDKKGVTIELTGRVYYVLGLVAYGILNKRDVNGHKALEIEQAKEIISQIAAGDTASFFSKAFDHYIRTFRALEAYSSLVLSLDLLRVDSYSIEHRIGGKILWELLSGIEGFDDFLGKINTHFNWVESYLANK